MKNSPWLEVFLTTILSYQIYFNVPNIFSFLSAVRTLCVNGVKIQNASIFFRSRQYWSPFSKCIKVWTNSEQSILGLRYFTSRRFLLTNYIKKALTSQLFSSWVLKVSYLIINTSNQKRSSNFHIKKRKDREKQNVEQNRD